MAKRTGKRIRLTNDVELLAMKIYNEKYSASGMSFTVFVNQKLFESLSGFSQNQEGWAAEGTTRPECGLVNDKSVLVDQDSEDDDLDLDEVPNEF